MVTRGHSFAVVHGSSKVHIRCSYTLLITLMFAGEMGVLGVFSECSCSSICRKEVDSPWSWLVCVCGTVIIALFFGVSLNFGILFPVLMDYFQETRERTGKFRIKHREYRSINDCNESTSQCCVSRGS